MLLSLGAILIALTFIGYHSLKPVREMPSRIPIAVVDLINGTGDPQLDGLSDLLIINLEQSKRLDVLTRSRMYDVLRQLNRQDLQVIQEQTGREICKFADVDLLVSGTIQKIGQLYSVDFRIVDVQTDRQLFSAKSDGHGKDSIPSLMDRIAEQIRSELQEPIEKLGVRPKVADVTTSNLEAYQHYVLGEQQENHLQFAAAIAEYQRAVTIDPTFAIAFYRMAACYESEGKEGARDAIRKARTEISHAPEKEQLYIQAESAAMDRDFDRAIRLFKQILERYPDEKEALFNVGARSYTLSDYPTAETYLQRSLALDPSFERALQTLIQTYREQGKYDQMRHIADQYVAKQPQSPQAYIEQSNAQSLAGDIQTADKTLQNAQALFPREAQLAYQHGLVQLAQDQFPAAEETFHQLLDPEASRESGVLGYDGLALLDVIQGKYQSAMENFDREVEERIASDQPEDTISKVKIMKDFCFFAADGDLNSAVKLIGQIPSISNHDNIANEYLFYLQLTLGEPQKAASLYKQQLMFSPFGPVIVRAYQQKIRGSCDDAIRNFLKGTQNLVSDSILYVGNDLANCYVKTNDPEHAIRILKKIQSRCALDEPYFFGRSLYYARTYDLLGKIYDQMGDADPAAENYQKFLDLWKDADPSLHELVDAKERMKAIGKEQKKPVKEPPKPSKQKPRTKKR